MDPVGKRIQGAVPVKQPEPQETRGGEEDGDWQVAADAVARAAALRAQLVAAGQYALSEEVSGGDTA